QELSGLTDLARPRAVAALDQAMAVGILQPVASDAGAVSMHPLIHTTAKQSLQDSASYDRLERRFVSRMAAALVEAAEYASIRQLAPHIRRALMHHMHASDAGIIHRLLRDR